MTLDPKEAANSLDDIATIERRTRETLFYAGSSDVFVLWGVLSVVANLVNWRQPWVSGAIWIVADIVGIAGTFVILARRVPRSQRRYLITHWGACYAAFLIYGAIFVAELAPLTARQQNAFWPTLVTFGYVLLGIWIGRFFVYVGLASALLVLIGYFGLGDWFLPWMAAVIGGGSILLGLWLRRPL